MQDKEFDELFRDKFEHAEIQPSLNLWNNIEDKLVVKRKRVFPVYWASAAAIVTAVTIGLLFQKPEKIQLTNTVTTVQKPVVLDADPVVTTEEAIVSTGITPHELVPVQVVELETHDAVEAQLPGGSKNNLLAMQPTEQLSHLDNKTMSLKQETIELPKASTLPVEEIMIASADVATAVADEPVNENKQAEGRGIRNVGDLVNFVVDRVDKREEKFIQFKTDDDENSSLVALNIGMFRFNQKKHK